MIIRSRPRSGWLAQMRALFLTLFASAALAAGPKAYVGNFKDNTVSVIDTRSGSVVATLAVAPGPHGMAMSPDGETVYVSGDGGATLSVIDTRSDRVVHTIEVGKTPHGLAMTGDGRLLLVAVNGEDRIAFVDTATRSVVASVAVARPHTIAIRPDNRVAYVASQEAGNFALGEIDIGARRVVRSLPLDKPPRDLEFGHDGKSLYYTLAGVNAIEVLDAKSDQVVAEIPTGASPHIAAYYRGAKVGVGVIQGPGELLLFDPASNTPLRSIAVGKQPHWVATSGDGRTAYVTNEGSNDVTVVDLATGRTTTIAVGTAPRKVIVQKSASAAASGGAEVSIANFAFTPPQTTINAGESVTWSNDNGAPHGLVYRDGAPGSDFLLPGENFRRTFEQPGNYDYYCAVHAYMTGRVIVLAR